MNANISSEVQVWDQDGSPVLYEDLEDLTNQLDQLLTPNCKIHPVMKMALDKPPLITQLRIVKVDYPNNVCPKCNQSLDPVTAKTYLWDGADRYMHEECVDKIFGDSAKTITHSHE